MKEGVKIQAVKFIFLCIVVLGLLTNCNGQKKAAVDVDNTESNSNASLTLLLEGNYAPADSAEEQVITNAKDLSIFFSKINMTRKPGIPVPNVDFSKEMVLIYCAGANGNGTQPKLIIEEETDDELVLKKDNVVDKEKPALTVSPFSIYTIPITSKHISFQ